MSKNDKNKKEIHTSEGNDVLFPLIFGIVATILMAIVSHFIGNYTFINPHLIQMGIFYLCIYYSCTSAGISDVQCGHFVARISI